MRVLARLQIAQVKRRADKQNSRGEIKNIQRAVVSETQCLLKKLDNQNQQQQTGDAGF